MVLYMVVSQRKIQRKILSAFSLTFSLWHQRVVMPPTPRQSLEKLRVFPTIDNSNGAVLCLSPIKNYNKLETRTCSELLSEVS